MKSLAFRFPTKTPMEVYSPENPPPLGVTDHAQLSNLDYPHAGHTGFLGTDQTTPQTVTKGKPIFGAGLDVVTVTAGIGTVTITGTTTCTGTGTKFKSTFKVGDSIIITATSQTRAISAITSDTVMTIASATNTANSAYTRSAINVMTVQGNGNVGFNNTAPNYTVDVNGSFAVKVPTQIGYNIKPFWVSNTDLTSYMAGYYAGDASLFIGGRPDGSGISSFTMVGGAPANSATVAGFEVNTNGNLGKGNGFGFYYGANSSQTPAGGYYQFFLNSAYCGILHQVIDNGNGSMLLGGSDAIYSIPFQTKIDPTSLIGARVTDGAGNDFQMGVVNGQGLLQAYNDSKYGTHNGDFIPFYTSGSVVDFHAGTRGYGDQDTNRLHVEGGATPMVAVVNSNLLVGKQADDGTGCVGQFQGDVNIHGAPGNYACSGTAGFDCSHFTDETSCVAYGECGWASSGGSCSQYGCTDQSNCESAWDGNCGSTWNVSGYCSDSNCSDQSSCTSGWNGNCSSTWYSQGYCNDSNCTDSYSCTNSPNGNCGSTWVVSGDCSDSACGTDRTACEGSKNGNCGASWTDTSYCSDSSYTNQYDCESNSNTWYTQGSCSDNSCSDQSSCEGTPNGNCASTWNDYSYCSNNACSNQSSCEGTPNGYCGSTWNDTSYCSDGSCSNQSSCEGTSYTGCNSTWNDTSYCTESSCSNQSNCEATPTTCGGTWNSTGGTCTGTLTCAAQLSEGACTPITGCGWVPSGFAPSKLLVNMVEDGSDAAVQVKGRFHIGLDSTFSGYDGSDVVIGGGGQLLLQPNISGAASGFILDNFAHSNGHFYMVSQPGGGTPGPGKLCFSGSDTDTAYGNGLPALTISPIMSGGLPTGFNTLLGTFTDDGSGARLQVTGDVKVHGSYRQVDPTTGNSFQFNPSYGGGGATIFEADFENTGYYGQFSLRSNADSGQSAGFSFQGSTCGFAPLQAYFYSDGTNGMSFNSRTSGAPLEFNTNGGHMKFTGGVVKMPSMPTSDPADGTGTLWFDSSSRIVYMGT